MRKKEVNREIIHFSQGEISCKTDLIVTEVPMTIKINGEEFVTIVCTPGYMEDMVIGYLASEGVITKYEDIKRIWIQEAHGYIHVETDKKNPYFKDLQQKRYITSCCGESRQGFVFANDALTVQKMKNIHVRITPQKCLYLMNELQNLAQTYKDTGGVHNAALCDEDGVILSRMDIGRHNTLDKIYGYCLKNDIPMTGKIVVFSGRVSSEILLKVAKIGCELVLSKSAPTELALRLGDSLGITIVGFIRKDSFNIYTGTERIIHEI